MLVAAVCFGTAGAAQALGPSSTTPVTVGAARTCIAVLPLALVVGTGWARHAPWGLLLPAGVGVAGYQLAFFAAVDLTGVAVGTVAALSSALVVMGVLSRLVNGERLTARWAIATALAIAGVALLAVGFEADGALEPIGVLLALLAGASTAVSAVLLKRALIAGTTPDAAMTGAFVVAALLLLPFLLVGDHAWLATPGGAALALYLGLVATALGYLLFGRGLHRMPVAETATLGVAEPLTAALLGIVVLAERPGVAGIAGMLLAGSGMLLLLTRSYDRRVRRPSRADGS